MLGLGSAFEKLSQNLPWNFPWSETIRKRAIRYLLQRYVGQFLLETLSLDQLTVDLTNGTGIIRNLALDIQSLNEVAEQLNLPFKFIDGYIGEILVNIPWRNIFGENCFVRISGLKLVLHPKQRDGDVSLVDSMIDSMSTSMQIAQECLSQVAQKDELKNYEASMDTKIKDPESSSIDAIEHFARAIDTILNKIKVRFTDSIVRLEYIPKFALSGIALEIRLDNIDYFDEAGLDKASLNSDKNQLEFASFTSKKFLIEGVTLYTTEFSSKLNSTHNFQHDSSIPEMSNYKSNDQDLSEEVFHDTYNDSMNNVGNLSNDQEIKDNGNDSAKKFILFAKLCNRQEIKLKLRKNDTVSGPKVHFEANCGALICFLSPRQVHLLLELSEGIVSPENLDNAEILDKMNENNQKLMNSNDYKKVEHELINHLIPPNIIPTSALNYQEGWSSPPDRVSDEEFLPINPVLTSQAKGDDGMTSSILTDVSELENSFTSTASSHIYGGYKKIVGHDVLTNFKIRLNSLCMIILHEDVLISSVDKEVVTSSSVTEMEKKAREFFSSIDVELSSDHCYEEYVGLRKKLQGTCSLSHLRFIGTSLVIDGTEKYLANKWELKTGITVGWCEIMECLNESESDIPEMIYSKLLTFKDKEVNSLNHQFYQPMQPKITVNFNQSQNIKTARRSQRLGIPKSEIRLNISECSSEIDISLIDRINILLNKQNVIVKVNDTLSSNKFSPRHLDNQAFFREIIEESTSKPETQMNLIIKSSHISLKIYFPIPDLRPLSDMNRIPWWKRNLRKENLIIEADGVHLNADFSSLSTSIYEILSNDIHILFQENVDHIPFSLLRASGMKGIEKGFNPIRIYIRNFPLKLNGSLEDDLLPDNSNIMTKSMMGFLEEVDSKAPSVFNTRQVASQQHELMNELKIPADVNELNRFINDTLKNVQFDIDITLSDIQFILPSKHIYEVVYNRLVSDLFLWVPSAPKKCSKTIASLSTMIEDLSIGTTLISDNYCNSEFKTFSSLKSENSLVDETEIGYQSIYEQRYNCNKDEDKPLNGQTFLGLQIKIMNAIGAVHTPYRDENSKVVHGKHGEVGFVLEQGLIFIASGYKGDINNCQGYISVNNVSAYHNANNVTQGSPIYLDPEIPLLPQKMNIVLCPCDMLCRMGGGNAPFPETKDRICLCFGMKFDPIKNEQIIDMSGSMFGLTFRHYILPSSESWLSQLGDMFSVVDYPVEGYSLPDVITELNFNFEFCSIDYRPLYLPVKAYFAIDSLAVSCNLTIKGNSSVLLIIVEDAGLFLSQNLSQKKVNLKNDYVCVIDLGVFELCMKLDNDSLNMPIQEILFSNNIVNIRTCSDSFRAFLELLIYLANEGDLIQEPDESKHSKDKRGILQIETEETVCSPYKQSTVNQYNIVENLMEEAMIESTIPENCPTNDEVETNVDVFFFPDENKKAKRKERKSEGFYPKISQTETETALKEALEDAFSEKKLDDNKQSTDEEFCVLDDIPGTGIKSPSGKPKAKHLKYENVLIKDEHFDPTNTYFQESRLCTPKHFPKPHTKYNLLEISLVWYIYGGNDFESTNSTSNGQKAKSKLKTKSSPGNSPNINSGTRFKKVPTVSFANGDTKIISGKCSPQPSQGSPILTMRSNAKWFAVGGVNRCHDTLMEIQASKIRLKYELYPEECSIESRHVLVVNDVEIRDRLVTSKINKFLYQFSSECFPKQASSNMIQVKSITKRNDPTVNTSETSLSISLRPIRLNVDQDALMFLSQFTEDLLHSEKENEFGEEERPCSSLSQAPVMMVNYNQINDKKSLESEVQTEKERPVNAQSPIYFRNVIFSPDVPIKIDYHGKHIDINSQYGALAGLIIGLGQLDHSQVTLKRVEFKAGVLGVDKLINSLVNEWIYDIKKNQLPSILGGVGPMHSLMKLFGGVKDFIWLPVEQYHKDGRVLRGFQRGASAFTSSSAYAVLDLTGRFVGCVQSTAETMYDIVSSGPSVRSKSYKTRKGQPKDIREGLTTALGLVQNGLGDTAQTLIKVASEEHSHKGVSGAVGGVLRQIPPSLVQPIIIASEATCTVLGGMTNQLVPDARKEAEEKWKL